MSNTATKVNNYIALGYIFLASETKIEESSVPVSQETVKESLSAINDIQNEDILPVNNQIMKTLNITANYNSLRI